MFSKRMSYGATVKRKKLAEFIVSGGKKLYRCPYTKDLKTLKQIKRSEGKLYVTIKYLPYSIEARQIASKKPITPLKYLYAEV